MGRGANTGRVLPLQALPTAEANTNAQLRELVESLVDGDPYLGDGDEGDDFCSFCFHRLEGTDMYEADALDASNHEVGCSWLRAKKYLAGESS